MQAYPRATWSPLEGMGNQLEKSTENKMDTGVNWGLRVVEKIENSLHQKPLTVAHIP